MRQIAEVRSCCGRLVLFVADIAVAMQGDKCRQELPDEIAEPIPQHELETATIGGETIKETPLNVIRFFRGEAWTGKSLAWAASEINKRASF